MNLQTLRGIAMRLFPSAEMHVNRYNVVVLPLQYEPVNYDTLSQFAYEVEQSGGGRPRIDIETAPGEFGGSEVTPADSPRTAFRVWMEVES